MSVGPLTYEQAIARLGEAQRFGINPSLDGMRALVEQMGLRVSDRRFVQVTGTNGKTSVTRMTGALLTEAGYRTGVYTSPHLISYTERIEIDGAPVSEEVLASALTEVFDAAEAIGGAFTEFELLTAAAFAVFRASAVEWAVLEVGMGGRWDATSVVDPDVAVITGVGLDHTDQLGTTREEIAWDKAHIIKRGSIAIIGPGCAGVEHIFENRAVQLCSRTIVHVGVGDEPDVIWKIVRRPRSPRGTLTIDATTFGVRTFRLSLHAPSYQAPNAVTAAVAAGMALLSPSTFRTMRMTFDSLRQMTFPGRFELLRATPPLVIDGAHNPQAAGVLATAIGEAFGTEPPVVVLAILADKDAEGIVRALTPVARAFVVSENDSPRCMPAGELATVVEHVTGSPPLVQPYLPEALRAADALGGGIVVTGSLYTAGAVRALLMP